jgi:hypothetical protein
MVSRTLVAASRGDLSAPRSSGWSAQMVRSPGPGMERKSGLVPRDDAALEDEIDWSIAEVGADDA